MTQLGGIGFSFVPIACTMSGTCRLCTGKPQPSCTSYVCCCRLIELRPRQYDRALSLSQALQGPVFKSSVQIQDLGGLPGVAPKPLSQGLSRQSSSHVLCLPSSLCLCKAHGAQPTDSADQASLGVHGPASALWWGGTAQAEGLIPR